MTREQDPAAQADLDYAWVDRVLREELRREAVPDDGFTDSVLRALPVIRSGDAAAGPPRAWARHWASLSITGGLGAMLALLISWWPGLFADLVQTLSPGATRLPAEHWVPSAALLGLLIWWSWWWCAQASE